MTILSILSLCLAVVATPWLLARHARRDATAEEHAGLTGLMAIALNTLLPVLLHLGRIPVAALPLAGGHAALALALAAGARLRRLPLLPPRRPEAAELAAIAVVFAVLVLPVTHMAGVDTYKWQDLADSVRVEQRIAWFLHPASLFGFTPRSYPSAQPLVLASVQTLGGIGIDWGFYAVSLLFGLTGIAAAYLLGRRLFADRREAAWFSFLYVLSPVFLRYNYWATGRGLLLALLPMFLLLLLRRPGASGLLAAFGLAILLGLSHKAGLAAAVLIPAAFAVSAVFRRWTHRSLLAAVLVFMALAGAALAADPPSAVPAHLAVRAATRLAWLAPLACMGFCARTEWTRDARWKAMLLGSAATVPLLFAREMYGALPALPFVAFAAAAGRQWLEAGIPPARRRLWRAAVVLLTVAAAAVLVRHQAQDSPSRRVYEAARFLQRHDPSGPYRIEAPGRVRPQIQGYVAGCPRFTVTAAERASLTVVRPPRLTGLPSRDFRNWVDYLRGLVELDGAGTDGYGDSPVTYHVVVDGQGSVPRGAVPVYARDGVSIHMTGSAPGGRRGAGP